MPHDHLWGARVRLALRRGRAAVRRLRPLPHREPLGPVSVGARTLTLRPPRPDDATAWCAVRLAEQAHLRDRADAGGDWAVRHTPLAWLERCTALRRAERDGARPHVVLLDGELVGECGVDAVDLGTRTGELSIWLARRHGGPGVTRVAVALVCLSVLDPSASPVARLVAPTAVDNPRAAAVFADLGFTCEATLTGLRETTRGRVDHQLWVLHRTPAAVDRLRVLVRTGTSPAGSAA